MLLEGRNRTKADIAVYEIGGRRVALKTYGRSPAWIRHSLGRWQTRREAASYRAAAGLDGIVPYLGRPEAWALATEWIDGRSLPELGKSHVDGKVFDDVRETLARLHARGIALTDLHHRNVVVASDGHVFVLDLAAAWIFHKDRGPLRQRLFQRLTELDYLALARMQARWTGGDPEQAVSEIGGPIATWHRRGRRVKRLLNRLRGRRKASKQQAGLAGTCGQGQEDP